MIRAGGGGFQIFLGFSARCIVDARWPPEPRARALRGFHQGDDLRLEEQLPALDDLKPGTVEPVADTVGDDLIQLGRERFAVVLRGESGNLRPVGPGGEADLLGEGVLEHPDCGVAQRALERDPSEEAVRHNVFFMPSLAA